MTPRLQLRDAGVDTNVFQTLVDPTRDEVVVFAPAGRGRRSRSAGGSA